MLKLSRYLAKPNYVQAQSVYKKIEFRVALRGNISTPLPWQSIPRYDNFQQAATTSFVVHRLQASITHFGRVFCALRSSCQSSPSTTKEHSPQHPRGWGPSLDLA